MKGSLPPTVNDRQGNPRGFWSITLYQTDATESAAPFITQASVLNTAYSTANIAVTAVDPSTHTITVEPSAWGPLIASSPILFGSTAAKYGLTPGMPYYVRPPRRGRSTRTPGARRTRSKCRPSGGRTCRQATYRFKESNPGPHGGPGSIVQLQNPGGAVNLRWGPIQPVSQLGSQQLTSGKLARNRNGSVTIWIAPTLPAGAPATNWIPTPSAAYYQSIYQA